LAARVEKVQTQYALDEGLEGEVLSGTHRGSSGLAGKNTRSGTGGVSGAERVRPNPPPTLLGCEVRKNGKRVGNVICSADLKQLPFRNVEGYEVEVIATGNPPVRHMSLRLRNFNGYGKTTTNTGTGRRRSLPRLPEETAGDKR